MKVDDSIRVAAVNLVRTARVASYEQIPGVPGLYVAPAPAATIQTMSAFREDGIEYVIGPLRKL